MGKKVKKYENGGPGDPPKKKQSDDNKITLYAPTDVNKRRKQPNLQFTLPDASIASPIEYLNSYYNSDEFKKRSGDAYEANKSLFNNASSLYNVQEDNGNINGSWAVPANALMEKPTLYGAGNRPTVTIDNEQALKEGFDIRNDIYPHEYSHTIRNLYRDDEKAFIDANRNQSLKDYYKHYEDEGVYYKKGQSFSDWYNPIGPHEEIPNENYADLNTLRWQLYKSGIYDSRKGPMKIEDMNRAMEDPKLKKDFIFNRLLRSFKPEEIVKLNNTIASNDPKQDPSTAKNGAIMAKKYKKAKSGLTVEPKYFEYGNLPCIGCKDNLMADAGLYMGPGPRVPGLSNSLSKTWPNMPPLSDGSHPIPGRLPMPGDQGQGGDTSQVQPGQFINPSAYQKVSPNTPPGKRGPNYGNAALLGLAAFDAVLPNPYNRQQVVQPQMAYNPNPYGTGSQAIMQDGGSVPTPMPRTNLSPQQEKDYNSWRGKLPKNLQYEGDYNLRQLWLENPSIKPSANMHFPDKYKLPNHPTFSNESMYFNPINQYQGGHWQETDSSFNYIPYNSQYKQPIVERKADYGYVLGEDENNSPSAKNGKQMKSKKKNSGAALFGFSEDALPEAKDGHWIQGAVNPAHKGYCTPMTKSTCTPRRKALAKTFKKHHGFHKKEEGGFVAPGWDLYDYGGIIPDPMSNFSPHEYEDGGNVNGGAKIREVGPNYPNTDLLEQWLLYANGGGVPGGGYLNPSLVKDSENRAVVGKNGQKGKVYKTARDRDRVDLGGGQFGMPMNILGDDYYNANIPEPGYSPMNINPQTNYSATFPQGSGQQSTYFPNQGALDSFINNNPNLLISSQQGQGRGSAAFKNIPMENGGGVNGEARIREVGPNYPNTDLMEQWLLYENGGALSSGKAQEMLRDGTANGKKLTAKQKKYFGMVAAGKAAMGTEIGFTGPGSGDPKSSDVNWNSRNLSTSPINRDARAADDILAIIGNNYDPYNGAGKANLRSMADSQLATEAGVRISQLRAANPNFGTMTPEQRINTFYQSGATGKTGLDQFIRRTQSLGGSPAAYWQNHPANMNRQGMKNGGIMYDDGGQVDTMWGGSADLESYNPYDGGMIGFNGPSHDNGGIGMAYNGNPVEVEGGEYAAKDQEGNLNIFGNMYMPGTKTKFKAAAGAMASKEKRYSYLKDKGSKLVNDSNPANAYDQLAFNAGRVMMQGGQMGQADIASKKERLASLQKSMLDMAAQHGLDPFEMSKGKMKKAKGGASIPFSENGSTQSGDPDTNDPTRADRNMNPGNIRYGKFAQKYGAKKDKDGFAIFPDRQTGEKAMQALLTSDIYKNMSAKDAITKWTGGHPYRYDLGPITDKKISEMNPDELSIVMGTMTKGEGTRYGMTGRKTTQTIPTTPIGTPNFTPYHLPDYPVNQPVPPADRRNPVPYYDQLDIPKDKNLPSNVEPLHLNQLAGELYGAATNKVEPVPAQRYEPQLYTPYQVSFQDRLNANQSAFNAQQRLVGAGNPAALGALGAQKYQADQGIYGDEFRTNQAIANDITNKNIALVNDANLKNLGIADTQMTRQSQARSKTREFNQMILNSISDKYAKNDYENKRLAAYENLYDYRFVPTDDGGQRATYFGPNAMFNYEGRTQQGSNSNSPSRTISRYDAQGNLKGWAEYDDSELRDQQKMLDLEMKRRKLPLMPVQGLNK